MKVIDTTLRDGEQSAEVSFSIDEKAMLAKLLNELGVDTIEAGIPFMGIEEQQAIYSILELGLDAEILTWNRMNTRDIKKSINTGAKNVHISVPTSDLYMKKKLGMTKKELMVQFNKVLDYAFKNDLTVSVGAEDASRADELFLANLYATGIRHGVKRIRYADTVSALTPFTCTDKIQRLQLNISQILGEKEEDLFDKVLIDFHGHNDFGMGTANALAAYKAGARGISCSVNGLGERAGNTALEEIVVALEVMEGIRSNIDKKKIMLVSRMVESFSGRKLQASKPIVGDLVFSHESGMESGSLVQDINTYLYLDPKVVGRKHSFVRGKHSILRAQ